VRAIGAGGAPSTAQLARTCGLPVATAARLLATLSDEGFVERTRDDAGWTLEEFRARYAQHFGALEVSRG